MVSVDRSEKVTFKYGIFNHVYACFLCLNIKRLTLPAEKGHKMCLSKLYFIYIMKTQELAQYLYKFDGRTGTILISAFCVSQLRKIKGTKRVGAIFVLGKNSMSAHNVSDTNLMSAFYVSQLRKKTRY